jgi:hypothetical protein
MLFCPTILQQPVYFQTENYCGSGTSEKKKKNKIKNLPTNLTKFLILVFVFQQITCAGKCSVRQGVQSVALELHICEFRLRMSDTLAAVSPAAEISLLDGDTVLVEDAIPESATSVEVRARWFPFHRPAFVANYSSQSTHFSPQCERDYVSRRVRKKKN